MNPSTKTSVGFSRFSVSCSIGLLPHEKSASQEIMISLKVQAAEFIDYTLLSSLCELAAKETHHDLLETLADKILSRIEKQFHPLNMWIKIEKPQAIQSAACAFVAMERACPTH